LNGTLPVGNLSLEIFNASGLDLVEMFMASEFCLATPRTSTLTASTVGLMPSDSTVPIAVGASLGSIVLAAIALFIVCRKRKSTPTRTDVAMNVNAPQSEYGVLPGVKQNGYDDVGDVAMPAIQQYDDVNAIRAPQLSCK
jgi:hypothetical protein